ncbi:MAG: ATP-binding protein [bacterium]
MLSSLFFPGLAELLTGVLAISFGVYVALHDHEKPANFLFFMFCLVITGRCIGDGGSKLIAWLYGTVSHPILNLNLFFSSFIATVGMHLCLAFPAGYPKWLKKWQVFLIYLPATFLAFKGLTDLGFFFDDFLIEGGKLVKVRNQGYLIFTANTFLMMIGSITTFVLKFRYAENPLIKNQIRSVIPGVWIGGLITIFPGLVLSYFGYHISAAEVGMLTILAFIGLGVIRYQAFDVKTAIHYTLFWLLSFVVFTAPIVTIPLVTNIEDISTPWKIRVGLMAWGGLSVLYFYFLNQSVFPKIRDFTLRRKVALEKEAATFLTEGEACGNLEELRDLLQKTLKSALYATDVQVYLKDSQGFYHKENSEKQDLPESFIQELTQLPNLVTVKHIAKLNAPSDLLLTYQLIHKLEAKGQLFGWILVNEKRTLKPYTADDTRFFTTIATLTASMLVRFYQLNKAKQVTSEIIHELKNTSVGLEYTVANLASKQHLTDEEKEMLQEVLIEMGKLHKFSRKHLSSEMVDKVEDVETAPILLNDLIREVSVPLRTKLEEKSINLRANFKSDFLLFGDNALLKIVIVNLIENAIKFLDKPEDIVVEAEETETLTTIHIIDKGPGFSDAHKHLAKSWLDGEGKYMSSGFGLSLCQKIVQKHGGQIRIISAEGAGTTVSVELPKVREAIAQ